MASKILAGQGRVSIRKFRRSDLAERILWPPYADPFFTHLNYNLTTFVEREAWILPRMVNSGRLYFAMEDEEGHFVGEMSLRDVDPEAKATRLGIHLASHKVSQGYGREGMEALLSYYFGRMKWKIMFLDVAAYNFRAIRLYENLHFEHLAPFWRHSSVDSNAHIWTDNRYANVRRFFRKNGSFIEVLHYDMALTAERYYETLPMDKPATIADNPPIA